MKSESGSGGKGGTRDGGRGGEGKRTHARTPPAPLCVEFPNFPVLTECVRGQARGHLHHHHHSPGDSGKEKRECRMKCWEGRYWRGGMKGRNSES